jgi:hypothetical protein
MNHTTISTISQRLPWVWDGAALVALAAVCVGLWGDCLWGGQVPVAAVYQQQMRPWSATRPGEPSTRQWDSLLFDSVAQFYPWRLLTHRAAQSGELPLWNPYQFSGTPLVGNGQSALFYCPNWLYWALHPRIGMGLSAALHMLLGGVFVYGLGRCWQLQRPAALLAALAFAAGGFVITWMELPTLVNSLIWLPLAWWGIEVARGGRLAGGAIMLSLALGLTLLAGHLQIAAYVWLFVLGYGLVALTVPAAGASRLTLGRWLGVAVVLGGGLSLVQVLPSLELGSHSTRGAGQASAAGFAFHQQRSLQPLELLTLLHPDFFGSPVRGDYPGISYSEHCGFVGAVTLLCGLGGLIIGWRRKRLWLLAGISLFALGGALGGPPAWLLYWGVPKLGQAGGFARLLSVWTLSAALWGGLGLDVLLRALADSTTARWQLPAAKVSPPASTLDNLSPLRQARQWSAGVLAVAVLGLWAVQVLPWAIRFNPRSPAAEVYPETPLIAELRARAGQGRIMAVTPRREWQLGATPSEAVMPPNTGTAYGLRFVEGYDSLFPADSRARLAQIEQADPSPAANGNMVLLEKAESWVSQVACLVAAEGQLLDLGAPLVRAEGCEVFAGTPGGARRATLQTGGGSDQIEPMVSLVTDSFNRVKLRLHQATAGTMVLRDSPYPGWRGAVDGQLRAVESVAERGERHVKVEAGEQQVEMVYWPELVVIGGFISLLAWLGLMLTGWWSRGWRETPACELPRQVGGAGKAAVTGGGEARGPGQ